MEIRTQFKTIRQLVTTHEKPLFRKRKVKKKLRSKEFGILFRSKCGEKYKKQEYEGSVLIRKTGYTFLKNDEMLYINIYIS